MGGDFDFRKTVGCPRTPTSCRDLNPELVGHASEFVSESEGVSEVRTLLVSESVSESVSEPLSEVMTLSESVFEVSENLVSVSESVSEV